MLRIFSRSKDGRAQNTVPRKLRPSLEGLEERTLLYATLGDAWAIPARITLSFVPDGTNVGGLSSNLYSTLNAQGTTATWQLAFQKAAAYWSSNSHINMAIVSDNGAEIGATGNQQGDSQFGDIRIAMANQGNNGTLAATFLPPKANGGSLAGDIVFNSYYTFKLNADYDLQTVALHEVGHALGLDHSTVTTADMYPYYSGLRQSPTADDIAGIQAVYGTYPTDTDKNTTINTSTNITSLMSSNGQISIGNLSTSGTSDLDWFYVTAPANTTGTMTVTMQASGLSMLNPKIAVYNSAKTGISQYSSTTNLGGNATVTITGVTAGQGYYVRASAATSPGAYGAYGLLVNFGSASQPPIAPPFTTVAATADQGGGSSSQTTRSSGLASAVARMTLAMSQYSTAPQESIKILTTEATQLLGMLNGENLTVNTQSSEGGASSPTSTHLSNLLLDLAKPDMKKAAKDLNLFLGEVVQVGALAGFGDRLTVSAAHHSDDSGNSASKPSDSSNGTVIGIPPAPVSIHKHATQHPKGSSAHFRGSVPQGVLVRSSLPVANRANWVSRHA